MRPSTIAFLGLTLALTACSKDDPTPADAGVDQRVDVGKTEGVKPPDSKPGKDLPAGKQPKITQILPSSGFADSTTVVTLVGENFASGMSAYIDGQPLGTSVNVASAASASFTMPKNPYGPPFDKPAKVGVGVMVGTTFSNTVDFWYTVVTPMTADFKGVIVTAKSDSYRDFPSDPIQGKVALTLGADAGAAPTLKAELGYGKEGTDPSKDSTWRWFPATFKQKNGGYDLFEGTLTVPLAQTYDVAYRFSKQDGYWVYADTDEANLAYEPAKAAKLTATNPPPGYCMTNQDCVINKYEVTCKVNASDKKLNKCVECLTSADCTGYANALGPTCQKELCGCAADADCTTPKPNPNGAKCITQGGYCGCTGDTNCVAPAKCYQDQNTGMTTCN